MFFISAVFADCGEVDDVRILREPDGKIRGFCYVQFSTAQGATAGLNKHGSSLDGKQLKVAISNPGKKGPQEDGGFGRGPPRDASRGGRGGKSMLAMVPRVVKRPAPPGTKPGLGSRPSAPALASSGGGGGGAEGQKAAAKAEGGNEDGAAKKDNDFFKNLFAKGSNL